MKPDGNRAPLQRGPFSVRSATRHGRLESAAETARVALSPAPAKSLARNCDFAPLAGGAAVRGHAFSLTAYERLKSAAETARVTLSPAPAESRARNCYFAPLAGGRRCEDMLLSLTAYERLKSAAETAGGVPYLRMGLRFCFAGTGPGVFPRKVSAEFASPDVFPHKVSAEFA